MSHHDTPVFERHCDVCVIGGSAAGLAAALQLGRQRRSVIVLDAREPRNAPAAHLHSYLGFEGRPPAELLEAGRAEVRRYGGEIIDGRVSRVTRTPDGGLRAELAGGHSVIARRVLAATGITDELPEIEGIARHWGREVLHCPFCHGYEVRDQAVAMIVTHPAGLRAAPLFRQLTSQLTIILHDAAGTDPAQLAALAQSGVRIVEQQVRRITEDADGRLTGVQLADGTLIEAAAVVTGPRFRARAEPLEGLGLHPAAHPSGLGDVIETDTTGATTVPGVFAAGSVTDPGQQVLEAAAHGSRVGAMIAFSLAEEELAPAAGTKTAGQAEWDARYDGEQVWSGSPNGTLVAEVAGMAPGRALDVGAGEGGDAIWLAGRGWAVTASDISARALDRVAAAASRAGLDVECRQADATDPEAFTPAGYDLVSAHYASIPRTADDRGIASLLDAVAPGGTLLIVSHDLTERDENHPVLFDPEAFVTADAVAAALAGKPDWDIERHKRRSRPPAAAAASHHAADIVLRARRRG